MPHGYRSSDSSVAPRPLVDSRFAASDDILRLRQLRVLSRQKVSERTHLAMPRMCPEFLVSQRH